MSIPNDDTIYPITSPRNFSAKDAATQKAVRTGRPMASNGNAIRITHTGFCATTYPDRAAPKYPTRAGFGDLYTTAREVWKSGMTPTIHLIESICHENLCFLTATLFGIEPNFYIHERAIDNAQCAPLQHCLYIGAQLVDVLGWHVEDVLGQVLVWKQISLIHPTNWQPTSNGWVFNDYSYYNNLGVMYPCATDACSRHWWWWFSACSGQSWCLCTAH